MKKIWFISLFVVVSVFCDAQVDVLENLTFRHDSIYQKYKAHRDTITLNTWLNIMQSNRYLELLLKNDSAIKNILQLAGSSDSIVNDLNSKLQKLTNENVSNFRYQKELKNQSDFYRKMYFMLMGLSLVFLTIIVALAILVGKHSKSASTKQESIKKYHTELYGAKVEINDARKIENQLASEINKLKKQLSKKNEDSTDCQILEEEKIMLENQILEIKKAYELELQKCMDFETQIAQLTQASESIENDTISNLTQKLENAENELSKLNHKLDQLTKEKLANITLTSDFEKLETNYNNEVTARLNIEQELQHLIDKLKNDFKPKNI